MRIERTLTRRTSDAAANATFIGGDKRPADLRRQHPRQGRTLASCLALRYVTSADSITEYAAGARGSTQPLRVISGSRTTLSNASSIAFLIHWLTYIGRKTLNVGP